MCDQDLWTDMVPDLQKLGTLHYGNVYEDSTLEGMARRVLDSSPERFVLVGFSMGVTPKATARSAGRRARPRARRACIPTATTIPC